MSDPTRPEGLAMVLNCAARLARRSIIAAADDPTSDQTDTNIVYMAQDLKRSHDQIRDEIKRLSAELAAAYEDADRLAARLEGAIGSVMHGMSNMDCHGNACNCGAHNALRSHAALRSAGES